MAKKKKPAKLTPKQRAVRASMDKLLGANKRMNAKSERAAARFKTRIAEVMPKDDPRSPDHLTVCVYVGMAPKGIMPIDVIKWRAACIKYGITPKVAAEMHAALLQGYNANYRSNLCGQCTFYAVLESGRAVDDLRTAALLATKAQGVIN